MNYIKKFLSNFSLISSVKSLGNNFEIILWPIMNGLAFQMTSIGDQTKCKRRKQRGNDLGEAKGWPVINSDETDNTVTSDQITNDPTNRPGPLDTQIDSNSSQQRATLSSFSQLFSFPAIGHAPQRSITLPLISFISKTRIEFDVCHYTIGSNVLICMNLNITPAQKCFTQLSHLNIKLI